MSEIYKDQFTPMDCGDGDFSPEGIMTKVVIAYMMSRAR